MNVGFDHIPNMIKLQLEPFRVLRATKPNVQKIYVTKYKDAPKDILWYLQISMENQQIKWMKNLKEYLK